MSTSAGRASASRTPKRSEKRADKPSHRCSECGWTTVKWVGRCPQCQEWGTVDEVVTPTTTRTVTAAVHQPATPITAIDLSTADKMPTGVSEFDRVLGGGLVSDAVMLLAGEPGIGKSTLLLDVAARAARSGMRVLYVSGEESAAQVASRAERIGALVPGLLLAAETDLGAVLGHIDAVSPQLLVVDSVQTVASAQVDGSPGNVSQVREVAAALVQRSKSDGFATVLVGHVTKDGGIAGPRILEHLVDVVLAFEGERGSRLRMVRAVKNRFGPTDEVGCFDLVDSGIHGLADPSALFLSHRDLPAPGTAVAVTLEGRRPLVAEVQALVAEHEATNPRRTTSGVDYSRLAMILAVLDRHCNVTIAKRDCYASTVGGVRILEPAADLSIAVAVASSVANSAVLRGVICIGEVGLAGDVRRVSGVERRLTEAARLGFTRAIVPQGSLDGVTVPDGMQVAQVGTIRDAITYALGGDERHPSRGGARSTRNANTAAPQETSGRASPVHLVRSPPP
ncbi:MAG: DNA repair protein RadA [Dermatophilus congolensis]|nr:DNA repair protein RadA [Dermatophilus congolensis]